MKNRIICVLAILFLIIFSITMSVRFGNKNKVYHQHIENKNHPVCSEDDESFCTHLPIVSIDTMNQEIPGEKRDGKYITTKINVYDKTNEVNHLTDESVINSWANIKYRGNSSLHFAKKGFLLKFLKKDKISENKVEMMGMGKHDEWILNGPILDKTLIRNYMMYNVSHEIMGYAPDVRFCELFVDGEYKGLYLMMESVSRGISSKTEGDRVPITKYKEHSKYTSYIVRADRGTTDIYGNVDSLLTQIKRRPTTIDVIYPGKEKMTEELNEFILEDLSKFEKTLYSYDYKSKRYGYKNFIDVDSFVNYFIINEFAQNIDAGSYSTYIYKDVKGKYGLYVWDFNNSFDNYQEEAFSSDYDFIMHTKPYYFMLMKDENFTKRIISRYRYLRTTYLSDEYLNNYIDDVITYLGPAIDRNFEVWGYTFDNNKVEPENKLYPESRNLNSYEDAILQLKTRIKERGKYLDDNIETIKQFSHESKVKKFTR